MRFIHAADIHLGAQPEKGLPWAAKRGEEIWETFQPLTGLLIKYQRLPRGFFWNRVFSPLVCSIGEIAK